MSKKPSVQERCTRWLLLLVFIHTVPVVWLTPVAGGTAPTAALLAYGIASIFTLDREGIALGLFALAPGLVFASIAWLLAWLLGKLLLRVQIPIRAVLLGCLTVGLLVAVYFPIYVAGGHNSSYSADLFSLFDGMNIQPSVQIYWITLHGVFAVLFAGALLPRGNPIVALVARWGRPVLTTAGALVLTLILYRNYALFLCRPFAELGVARAQVCVARNAGHDQRFWYERAAGQGNVEAIAWLIDKTPNREQRLKWLRQGAEEGDPSIQFALSQYLSRTPGAEARTEAERWLLLAAEGDNPDAQMKLADRLSKILYQTHSSERLVERNAWLERAAEHGSRMAKLRLAQHYSNGGMGYPVDFAQARFNYRELLAVDELTQYEISFGLDAAAYEQRLDELDAWEAGLERRDPAVMRAVAKRYLTSQFPGPGVKERGTELMEQLAADGDKNARDELIVMLRTGSGGVEKDVDAAKMWLVKAAEAEDPKAMERLVSNYMSGREGFPVDYPQARRWIEALIEMYRGSDEPQVQARVQGLKNDLAYIDRLGGYAGAVMMGQEDLDQLGQRSDAESKYQHAMQLLAGHGSKRRAEAIAELHQAADDGHGGAAWRLFHIYERGFPQEIDEAAALQQLKLAVLNHHFDATRELAVSYENGKRGLPVDLPRAIALYEDALAAGHDNRYGWNLDPGNFYHFKWLESRLRQARMKQSAL